MRHILTFKTNMPETTQFNHPKGYSICKLLKEQLKHRGIDVKPLNNYRDIAWSVDCQINSKPLFFFVGYLGTECTDWQLIVCSNSCSIKRLYGFKDTDERIQLAKVIHEILSNDNHFTNLKWFSKYTDKLTDEWQSSPS